MDLKWGILTQKWDLMGVDVPKIGDFDPKMGAGGVIWGGWGGKWGFWAPKWDLMGVDVPKMGDF